MPNTNPSCSLEVGRGGGEEEGEGGGEGNIFGVIIDGNFLTLCNILAAPLRDHKDHCLVNPTSWIWAYYIM